MSLENDGVCGRNFEFIRRFGGEEMSLGFEMLSMR